MDVYQQRWEQTRQRWRAKCQSPTAEGKAAAPRNVKELDLDPVVAYLMSPGQQGVMPGCPVPLRMLVDVMVDLWEADGLFD